MAELVRLQRFLSAAGIAARRKCEQLITAGRVSVNGKPTTVLGTKVDPDRDNVTVDGQAVAALDRFYVVLNKPKGCITAVSDDRGRPTVMDYLPNCPVPVKPVGRLDFYTEGVLLLTNDGELASRLLAPARHVPKTYHAKVHGQLSRDHVKALRAGVELDDGTRTQPAEVALLPSDSKYSWVAITIYEGKHRQIHRMLEALGFRVDKLQRVAFANLTFHHLRVGDARELTQQELNALRDTVELDHSAVARGRWKATREATDIPRRARAKARAEAASAEPQAIDGIGLNDARPSSERSRDRRTGNGSAPRARQGFRGGTGGRPPSRDRDFQGSSEKNKGRRSKGPAMTRSSSEVQSTTRASRGPRRDRQAATSMTDARVGAKRGQGRRLGGRSARGHSRR